MSNEKLGAEQGRETLQAIAQEIVANLGSCDASSDLGFKVIWATLDRHFGTGPKQAEQAHHARGAGRELEIRLDEAHRWNAQRVHHVGAPVKDWGIRRIDELEIALAGEPGADTGTTVAEELSGMLAERMIKLAIKIQGPYATFGPPESLERRKKSHQERIEELTGMLTTEFAECLERGTTPPDEGLALERAANWFEECGGKWDAEFIATQLRALAATQRAPVEQASVTDAVKLSGVGERHQLPGKARQQGSEGTPEREAATRTLPTDCIPETGAPDHAREGALRSAVIGALGWAESNKIPVKSIQDIWRRALADGKEGGE